MKTLKFDHDIAQHILSGEKTATWRIFDDKDLSVNDEIKIIDKVDPGAPATWQVLGHGKIVKIVEKNLGSVTPEDFDGHEKFETPEEMLQKYRDYYGQRRVTLETPVKMVFFEFEAKDDEAATPGMLLEEARIYTDGGSRGNPGRSACAYVICDPNDQMIESSGFYIGIATNNQAEYTGVQRALRRAQELGIDKVALFADSLLVVNQLLGLYKVKNQELAPLYQEVSALANSFKKITFTHIPREKNAVADALVNETLDNSN